VPRVLTLALGGAALAAAVAVAVAVTGGGGSSSAPGGPPYGRPASASTGPAAAKVATRRTKLGRVLVDGRGRTLYLFEKDEGMASSCYGACASVWPPLTTSGKPSAGEGVTASKLGTTKRSDGATEVTYNGHPLYTYAGDSAPGQTSGQGLDDYGAEWYALSAGGSKIDNG